MYISCGSLPDAQTVFDGIPAAKRDRVAWHTMMSGFAQCGKVAEALELCNSMQCHGMDADCVTWTVLFTACMKAKALTMGKSLHTGI